MIVPVRDGSWPPACRERISDLFDDSVLLNLAYNQAGQLTGAAVVDAGNPVEEARRIRDEAISLAVPIRTTWLAAERERRSAGRP